MHWPRQHGLIAAGRPACVCRGSVGRFLAGGSFASSPPPRARRARRCKSGAAALQQDAARACTTGVSRREPVCQRSAPGHRGALQQRHIRHRTNFDLGIHALIDIVEQTNCWQKAECKEWSSLFGTLCPIITR